MKKLYFFLLLFICFSSVQSQTPLYPFIKNYGPVFEVPFATEKPDAKAEYKIIVNITAAAAKPDSINDDILNTARVMNLHVLGGVAPEKLHVVVVVHNVAGFSVVNNETYQQKFHVDNPNIDLIKTLQAAGVKFIICGQTMMKRNISQQQLLPDIHAATSALTTLTTYQMKGYVMMKFQ
jgi:intracellular sulfur oxidation DsrE/DsrF family protein